VPELATQMYLGDGLYAKFDGYHVWLLANGDGVHTPASDTLALDPGVLTSFQDWIKEGYRDYNSGKTFKEVWEDATPSSG